MAINEDILFTQIGDYLIYQSYNEQAQMYYLCIPMAEANGYEMFLGFPKKDLINLSKDDVINEINDVLDNVSSNGIYILPDISVSELLMASVENDDRLYNIILGKVHAITSSVYKKITNNKRNIGSIIHAFKQTDSDTKFVNWLEIKLGNKNIQGINLMTLKTYDDDLENETNLGYSTQEFPEDGWTTLGGKGMGGGAGSEISHTSKNHLVKKKTPPRTSHGFSSIAFVSLVLIISLIAGISIGYLLMR